MILGAAGGPPPGFYVMPASSPHRLRLPSTVTSSPTLPPVCALWQFWPAGTPSPGLFRRSCVPERGHSVELLPWGEAALTGIYTWGFPLFSLERHLCLLALGPSARISKLRVPSIVIVGNTLGAFLTGVQQVAPLTLVLTGLEPLFPTHLNPT